MWEYDIRLLFYLHLYLTVCACVSTDLLDLFVPNPEDTSENSGAQSGAVTEPLESSYDVFCTSQTFKVCK